MIQAKDLRIGNFVYNETTIEVMEVYPIMISQIFKIQHSEHNIKPIPITEQWLIDLGFKIHRTEDTYNTFALDGINVNDGVVYLVGFGFLNHIKYIHQLQNLYFAITSKELTKQKPA